jgi:RNA polymerase sigma-70 factor (ECF subfamily)
MSAPVGAAQAEQSDGIEGSMASLRARVETDRAFERLYRKHVSDVYRYALALVRNEAEAEDITQTTFLNAFRAFQRGEEPRKAKSWLIAIAHNVCRQRFRHQSRRPQEVELDEDLAEAAVPEEGPSADDLVRALQHLSFNQRSALVMRELEGRPYSEIGEILDLPVSAVETLLFRARRALREQLESTLTCSEAEHLLSRQLDGRLERSERGALRAHLRACPECARAARSQRAQRAAWKSLAVVPLPGSLSSLLGTSGGASVVALGSGAAVKLAALGAAAVLVGGGTYEGVRLTEKPAPKPARSAPAAASARAASSAQRSATRFSASPARPVAADHAKRPAETASPPGRGQGHGRSLGHEKAPASRSNASAATSVVRSPGSAPSSPPGLTKRVDDQGVRAVPGSATKPRRKKQQTQKQQTRAKRTVSPAHRSSAPLPPTAGSGQDQGSASGNGGKSGQADRASQPTDSAAKR